MLDTGYFADCTVISRDKKWEAHKVILSRSPYFAQAFSTKNGFKEALESKITIEGFEPFEISWLLRYIYGLRIDVEQAKETSPNKSFLETCTVLWSIGDYFRLEELSQSALSQLQTRCRALLLQTHCVSTMLKEIKFLPDLEAGIRAAWSSERVAGPMRQDIMSLCVGIHPFIKDHASFIELLDEMSDFSTQYLKALLGCPGMQSNETHVPLGTDCTQCLKPVFDDKGRKVPAETFAWIPTSLNFWDNYPCWFCSRHCYNTLVDRTRPYGVFAAARRPPLYPFSDSFPSQAHFHSNSISTYFADMAASSQTFEAPEGFMKPEQQAANSDSPASECDKANLVTAVVNRAHLDSDLRMLESGALSDFTVVCGIQEWKVHRFVLSRCPYFKPMVSKESAFKENLESRVTITGFEPFEIEWLLRYIYSLQLNVEQTQTTTLFWLTRQCKTLYVESRSISAMLDNISFLPDLEAGIRAAWRPDRFTQPVRGPLMTVCSGLQPFLRDHKSFMSLPGELPEFATDFVQALMGCGGMQMDVGKTERFYCSTCNSTVFDATREKGKEFVDGAFIWTPISLELHSGSCQAFFCSKECYNSGRHRDYQYHK
ncbi:hypothetical protein J7T55_003739 [Diaporthe amygdali]|uniref:uncharacterized protein n=1 Tax=Phomopsis amygdali TaxID=1214568 RepID=UPI0022FF2F4C|nr:uncharacterized protein J7T55_003739 [Diaporthe amygdali]KAJ0117326.1 hypothetical protein J7T55_003739 [Diaporthe amygdali]